MLQKLTLIGNLGNEPELKYTPQGDAVTSFSLATNRKWTGQDGQPQEQTVWFRISVWGKQAEPCNQYLAKGRQVYVEGQLTPDRETGGPRIWTDNDGKARASFEVRAFQVQFLGGRSDSDDNGQAAVAGSQSQGGQTQGQTIAEDEIPF